MHYFKVLLQHDWSSANPKGPMSHLSLSPCTGSRLQLASSSRHWCLHIEQPQAQHPPTSTHYYEFTSSPQVWDLLASDTSWYHHREAQKALSRTFSFTVPGCWNDSPPPSGLLDPCQSSSNNWKLISSVITWLLLLLLHKKTTTTKTLCSLSLTSPCLASFALNNARNVVLQALPVTVCLFIMYRLLYSSIVSCFG